MRPQHLHLLAIPLKLQFLFEHLMVLGKMTGPCCWEERGPWVCREALWPLGCPTRAHLKLVTSGLFTVVSY